MEANVHYFCDADMSVLLVDLQRMHDDHLWREPVTAQNTSSRRKRLPLTTFPPELRALAWKHAPRNNCDAIFKIIQLQMIHDLDPMYTEAFQRR